MNMSMFILFRFGHFLKTLLPECFILLIVRMHTGLYDDYSNKKLDSYSHKMSDLEPRYSDEHDDHIQTVYGYNINKKLHLQPDNLSNAWSPIPSYSLDDTKKSSISFSNSLLNPNTFMKRTQINMNIQPSMKPTTSPTYSKVYPSRMTFSSISNLLSPHKVTENSAKKPSLYSYFESKKILNRKKGNSDKKISKEGQNRKLIKKHKGSASSIPNRWSDLVIGLVPNTAKHFLNLEHRRTSDLSSFRKLASKNADDFNTKKLRWLLNRTKRDIKGSYGGK